jgi:hypothetical protein
MARIIAARLINFFLSNSVVALEPNPNSIPRAESDPAEENT